LILAISVAIGGDCVVDISQVRSESDLFGSVASDPTVSRWVLHRKPAIRQRREGSRW
jgi:hypothetical protein